MSDHSKIEWTDTTWSPVTGCTKVSPGCDHCYIDRTPPFRMQGRRFLPLEQTTGATTGVQLHPNRLDSNAKGQPFRWAKPRHIFVCSLADLFHDDVPDDFIARVFAVMALTPRHTYQVLTKRHGRLRSLLKGDFREQVGEEANELIGWIPTEFRRRFDVAGWGIWPSGSLVPPWPLPNVWLGVSVENQQWADIRIPALLDTPAAVRFLSCEPLLGPVDLGPAALRPYERQQGGFWEYGHGEDVYGNGKKWVPAPPAQIDWVIVGGESGPGARPMHPDWARGLRDQCGDADVPFFFKQLGKWAPEPVGAGGWRNVSREGEWRPYERDAADGSTPMAPTFKAPITLGGRMLDGRTWDEMPHRTAVSA